MASSASPVLGVSPGFHPMPDLIYNAAVAGNIEELEKYTDPLDRLVTPNGNTILHICLATRNQTIDFVGRILDKCPSLLRQQNNIEEAPLHIAARYGHSDIVKLLIERAKIAQHHDSESGVKPRRLMIRARNKQKDSERGVEPHRLMIRARNKQKDTALHVAIQNDKDTAPHEADPARIPGEVAIQFHHATIVNELIIEDPDFLYSANKYGETPLYMASCIGDIITVNTILDTCKSVDYGGPDGRTALHAAIYCGDPGLVSKILEERQSLSSYESSKGQKLTKAADENGWTPLHYAAHFDRGGKIAGVLLKYDKSASYIGEKERNMTPLIVAGSVGNVEIMKILIAECPGCWEFVDKKGWNVLHYAVVSKSDSAFQMIIDKFPSLRYLMNERDEKGFTPLHLLAVSRSSIPDLIYSTAKPLPNLRAFNKQNLSPLDLSRSQDFLDEKEEISELLKDVGRGPFGRPIVIDVEGRSETEVISEFDEEGRWENKVKSAAFEKAKEYHLVVAALIATVTFTAGFTVPGGFRSDEKGMLQGTAVLRRKPAFQAFVITNATAMMLSLSAVFTHFLMALRKYGERSEWLFHCAFWFTLGAMIAMLAAFVTGTYAVVSPSLGLAIAACLIGLIFVVYAVFVPLKELYRIFREEEDYPVHKALLYTLACPLSPIIWLVGLVVVGLVVVLTYGFVGIAVLGLGPLILVFAALVSLICIIMCQFDTARNIWNEISHQLRLTWSEISDQLHFIRRNIM